MGQLTLEEYVKEYADELYKELPNLYKYINYILAQAGYMEDIRFYNQDKILDNVNYEYHIDNNTYIKACLDILESIDIRLKDIFLKYFNSGNIDINDENDTICATTSLNNSLLITIKRNYNIEDILATIHEFFHGIHLESNDLKITDDWYFISELFAIVGELYTLFYLTDNDFCTKDLDLYFNKFMSSIFMHNYTTLENGIFIDLYDKMQTITNESLNEYITINNLPSSYADIITDDEDSSDEDEFEYHVSATYSFAVPLAFLISRRMLLDNKYKKEVIDTIFNIKNYDLNTIFMKLGIKEYLEDDNKLLDLMNLLNEYITKRLSNDKVSYKIKKELW